MHIYFGCSKNIVLTLCCLLAISTKGLNLVFQ
uniref:Uncharacterized protein n=1 Tax=Anguilla anguilla TaxID=7936 RepID=A0A0E9QYP2_ANGAN